MRSLMRQIVPYIVFVLILSGCGQSPPPPSSTVLPDSSKAGAPKSANSPAPQTPTEPEATPAASLKVAEAVSTPQFDTALQKIGTLEDDGKFGDALRIVRELLEK